MNSNIWKQVLKNRFDFAQVKVGLFLMILFLAVFAGNIAVAQSNFTPLEASDVKEKDDHIAFSPGLQFGGNYRLRIVQHNGDNLPEPLPGETNLEETLYEQDARLLIRSTVHRNFSINLQLQTAQDAFNRSDLRDQPERRENHQIQTQKITIKARQAFLEYNPNPVAVIKLGQHHLNLGDRRGKVFEGIMSGFSQTCKAGTWCYEIGATKVAKHPADWLYFVSLDYPILEQRYADGALNYKLNVEIFRIFYTERDVPMARNMGPTYYDDEEINLLKTASSIPDATLRKASLLSSNRTVDQLGKPLYYDAIRQEYFGLRLNWESTSTRLWFDISANQGNRHYHLLRETGVALTSPEFGSNNKKFRSKNRANGKIAGVAGELDFTYIFNKQHELGLGGLYASGDKQKQDPDFTGNNFLRTLRGYYEIVPGNYRGTKLYFNGGDLALDGGSGLGHSVNNTQMIGVHYLFKAIEFPIKFNVALYKLARVEEIFNAQGKEVQDIGLEMDNTFSWLIDSHLNLDLELNVIKAGNAFSLSDQVAPAKSPKNLVQGVGRFTYIF